MSGVRMECSDADGCEAAALKLRDMQRPDADAELAVHRIMERVRRGGDRSLFELTEELDGIRLKKLMLDTDEIGELASDVDDDVIEAMKTASANITRFHSDSRPSGSLLRFDGSWLERSYVPLRRVGIYVPGGIYAYPSTVLMASVPAKIAGVDDLVIFTPPDRDGSRIRYIAAACQLSGVKRIFTVGGAQAIAAMAYGTESIRRVDKIVGPGNMYVAKAKAAALSMGLVGTDSIAGPTEILVIADATAYPEMEMIAYELLAQMEHGSGATAVLCSDSSELIEGVLKLLGEIISHSGKRTAMNLERNFASVHVRSPKLMGVFAEAYAPEHLFAVGTVAEEIAEGLRNAGSVFIGKYSSVAFGDYISGTNHILPTMGTARFSSPLQVSDFMKVVERQKLSSVTAEKLSGFGSNLAECEGLRIHSLCMRLRGDRAAAEKRR